MYVVFCLAYIIYFWRTWCIFWRNWCLWHWDVVFLTFLNWDGASNIFITKNVQIYVFIPWINFPKSSSYRVLCGKRYASLKKVHHPRLWGLWQLSGVIAIQWSEVYFELNFCCIILKNSSVHGAQCSSIIVGLLSRLRIRGFAENGPELMNCFVLSRLSSWSTI